MPGFKVKDWIRQILQWSLWAKLSAAVGVVFLAIVAKLLEDPVLAFRDWVGAFLGTQQSHYGWELLCIGIVGCILGMLILVLLQNTGLVSTPSTPGTDALPELHAENGDQGSFPDLTNSNEVYTKTQPTAPAPLPPSLPQNKIIIRLDRSNDFAGGPEGASTLAYKINAARRGEQGPVQFEVSCESTAIAEEKIAKLEVLPSRSPEQEREYRHMLLVRDGNAERILAFTACLNLAINNDLFRKETFLSVEDSLTNFLLGLRDIIFGIGTPIVSDGNSAWVEQLLLRRHDWFVWWIDDPTLYGIMHVDDEELSYAHNHYEGGPNSSVKYGKTIPFRLFELRLETFYRVALPTIAKVVFEKWGADSVPDAALDLGRWAFSESHPDKTAYRLT